MKNMLCPHVSSAAPYGIENVVHPPHENLLNLRHLWAMNRLLLMKILYISVCAVQGGKSSYRQGSVFAWNQP
jgi:hypothetical protein